MNHLNQKTNEIVKVSGLLAAVATPVRPDGRPDDDAFDRLVSFLIERDVDGVVIGGATSEYPHFETADRLAMIRRAAARLPSGKTLLVAIGSASPRASLDLGRHALDAGSRAVLLPMPLFFRYQQHDLRAYCAHVSRTLQAPCLLYDLPDFTNALATETAVDLLRTEPHIVGIKDSSGRPERLDAFVRARGAAEWSLMVGDDALLRQGMEAGWDGGISGIASFCPELLVALHRSCHRGDVDEAQRQQALLDELIVRLSAFPAPWGVRLGLHARGIDTGPLPLPLSPERREQAARYQEWLPGWLERAGISATVKS
jgi:4-hydroxy-tetrahydrodipicolinate synthase